MITVFKYAGRQVDSCCLEQADRLAICICCAESASLSLCCCTYEESMTGMHCGKAVNFLIGCQN